VQLGILHVIIAYWTNVRPPDKLSYGIEHITSYCMMSVGWINLHPPDKLLD
jgi:hypothetical protein